MNQELVLIHCHATQRCAGVAVLLLLMRTADEY